LLAASLLLAADGPSKEEPQKPGAKIWAGVSIDAPVYVPGTLGTPPFVIHCALVNDGVGVVDPDVASSQLLVNGQELKAWSSAIKSGPRDDRWRALPPGDYVSFSVSMSDPFKTQGLYKIVWRGKSFQAREIEVRVGAGKVLPRPAAKLWAGLSTSRPIHGRGTGPEHFMIHFDMVNDSDKIVRPEANATQLLVNGEELKDWSFIASNGPRDDRWDALPPGEQLAFSISMGDRFTKPGVYTVVWKGKDFQAREVEFRILPGTRD
jgi:hypothetical protein